jgi:hypothetical protein
MVSGKGVDSTLCTFLYILSVVRSKSEWRNHCITRISKSGAYSICCADYFSAFINTNYESDTKSYTVKVKATIGDGEKKNAEQIFTVNLLNINDETPTNITLSMSGSTDNHTITENTTNTNLGTLSVKVCPLASATLIVILRVLVVS